MDLKELLEKTADTDFLREMIGFTAQRLMELEVETLTGAAHGSRSVDTAKGKANIANKFATDGLKLAKGGKGASRAPKSNK